MKTLDSLGTGRKKRWFLENHRGYPVLYIRFSRAWPGYSYLYNIHKLHPEKE